MNVAIWITLFRALLVLPFAYFLSIGNFFSFVFFVIFLLLDFLDGFFARLLKQETAFGRNLDFAVDSLLVILSFVLFFIRDVIPLWFFVYLLLIGLVYGYFVLVPFRKNEVIANSPIGKLNGFVAYFVVFLLLLGRNPFVVYAVSSYFLFSTWYYFVFLKKRGFI